MAKILKRQWVHNGISREAYQVDYRDRSGRRRRRQFDKRKDAVEFAARADHEDGPEKTPGLQEACDEWVRACERGLGEHHKVERSTVKQYAAYTKNHFLPFFGDVPIGEITRKRVKQFRDHLLGKAIARETAKSVLSAFGAMMGEAVQNEHIATNPAHGVSIRISSREKEQPEIPSKTEMKAIMGTLDRLAIDENRWVARAWRRYRAMILTSIYTGLRISEIRGLSWDSVDLKERTITVSQRADAYREIGDPKSRAGRRTVIIPRSLTVVLMEWRMECPPGRLRLVFPNWKGNVESYSNIRRRCWVPLQERAGVVHGTAAKYPLHTLRHFRASMLIDSGATAKEVQVEMGHSSIKMTFDTYGHLFPEGQDVRRQRAENIDEELARHKR